MAKRIIRIALEVLSLLVLLGTASLLIAYWKQIPDQIPMHFDGAGQFDGLSGKRTILWVPAAMLVLYVSLSLTKTIRIRSLGKEVRIPAPLVLPAMKLITLAGFSYMTACAALVRPLGVWFLPVFLTAEFAPMVGLLIYARKNRLF
ncbi:MAG: DUF1648 domain-containing protein [Oscillospiraceae bacterium]|nr:DUF1648 domain-containing protein [Oscillospiraceae bacterium]